MPTNKSIVSEIVSKRTLNSKHYLLSDGSYQAIIHMGQIHFDDGEGNLYNINTDLFDEADFDSFDGPVNKHGKANFHAMKDKAKADKKANKLNRDNFDYQGLQVPFEAKIPRNFKRGYTIGKGVDKLTFKPVGASPAKGYVDSDATNKIHYQDAWNDADVVLELTDRGIKETITLKTDRAPVSFSFEVDGNLTDDLTAGELKLQPAWLEDSEGTKKDVSQTVRLENNKVYVDMVADVVGLVYPIVIDPTVTINPVSGYTDTGYSGTVYNQTYLMSGENRNNIVYTSYINFNLSSIPSGVQINSAYINGNVYMVDVDGNSSTFNIKVSRITSSWSNGSSQPSTYYSGLDAPTQFGYYSQTSVWKQFPATNAIKDALSGSTYYGLALELAYRTTGSNYQSLLYLSTTNTPYLSVDYNSPPTAPTVTAPNGGESINSQYALTLTASTDTDTAQASLQYQWQLSTDNGVTWKDIVALTSAGVTSYPYDFINENESSTCLIRVRAYDGSSYGPWDQSDGVFTIAHNIAPTAPTNLSPSGGISKDRAYIIRFGWQHNDPNSSDPQSKFDFQWRVKGDTTWNTISQVNINQFIDIAANTFPHGDIEWQVRTYDQAGLSGPYSTLQNFKAGDKPAAPTITLPADGATVAVANPTVQWSSSGQTGFTLSVKDATATEVYSATGTTNKAHTVQYDLANQSTYTIDVTISNTDNLSSDPDNAGITVSYTPPADPILSTQIDSVRGSITVHIENPVPSGTEPNVSYNDIYRCKQGETDFIRIGVNIPNDGSFTDYTPASDQVYEYYVRVYGDNGTFNDSAIISDSVAVSDAQIALTTDYSQVANVVLNNQSGGPQRDFKHSVDRAMMTFAGREYPVAEFSEFDSLSAGLSFIVQTKADIDMLRKLAYSRQTLLYRDSRGRREFVTLDGLDESDIINGWYSVSVSPLRVSFSEVV